MAEQTPTTAASDIKPVEYTTDELAYRGKLHELLESMRTQRDQPHPELDGMTYLQYYESNRRKDLSYLPPKKDKGDIRITTGHTREKNTTLLSTQLGMNFQADITAFDSDDLIVAELGDNMSDMVKKSREIEVYDKKRPIIYREMDAQGDVFVQELYIEDFRETPLEELTWDPVKDGVASFSLKQRMKKVFGGCASRMVNGKRVYLGCVRTEYIEDQDDVAIVNILSRQAAEAKYGKWERWKHVPKTMTMSELTTEGGGTYKDYSMVPTTQDQVAEVFVYRKTANRFMIELNGVMMLPIDYPLTAISPSGEIPMAQGKLEPISDFAYSKSQPAKTKIDQEVLDETTKLMIEGMRQNRRPPMGSKGKKAYSKHIFTAGRINPGMTEGDLFTLLPKEVLGLNSSDFSFYQLIKQSIEDKTINSSYSGEQQTGSPTATQVLQEKEQQMLKLGAAIDGTINLERRLTVLRIPNILTNWTNPIDSVLDDTRAAMVDRYRQFSVNTTLENGEKGVKIFRFTKDEYPEFDEETGEHPQEKEEEELSKQYGRSTRIIYMDPELLANIKYTWFIIINPTPKSNDKLSQLLFVQNLRTAMELFGPDAMNLEYVKQRFAILINEDYNKFFKKIDIQQMLQMGLDDPAVQNIRGNARPAKPRAVNAEQAMHPAEVDSLYQP